LNISVQVSASASVQVDNATDNSTYTTAGWTSGDVAAASTATVTNTSGGYTEMWKLSTYAQSNPQGGGSVPWTLVESTKPADVQAAPNQYSLFAVFTASSSLSNGCPAAGVADWFGTTTTVSTGLAQYGAEATTTQPMYAYNQGYAAGANGGTTTTDTGSGTAGAKMYPTGANGIGQRALCWKLTMPSSVTDTHSQTIQLVVTAQ
jgi:hypothetical protein